MSPWKRATLVEKGRPEAGSTGNTGTPPASSASWYALDRRRGLPVAVEPGKTNEHRNTQCISYKVHLNPSAEVGTKGGDVCVWGGRGGDTQGRGVQTGCDPKAEAVK